MNTKELSFEVMDGPSKDRLIDAFKYAYDKEARVPVEFSVARGYTAPKDNPGCAYVVLDAKDFRILSLQHEDGSGHSFNIEGYCTANVDGRAKRFCWFKMYYETKNRKGVITFKEEHLLA